MGRGYTPDHIINNIIMRCCKCQ